MACEEEHHERAGQASLEVHDPRIRNNADAGTINQRYGYLQASDLDGKLAYILLPVFDYGDALLTREPVEVLVKDTAHSPARCKAAEAERQVAQSNLEGVEAVPRLELRRQGAEDGKVASVQQGPVPQYHAGFLIGGNLDRRERVGTHPALLD